MTVLATALPGLSGLGPLLEGTTAGDSISVNKWNIEALPVTEKAIAPLSVSTGALQAESVDSPKIKALSVDTLQLAAGAVHTDNVESYQITAEKMSVTHLSLITGNAGQLTAGSLFIGNGGITLSAESSGGTPNTGLIINSAGLKMMQGGNVAVNIKTSGDAYFKGEVVCNKVTVAANSANVVHFGANVTIGGQLIINPSLAYSYIYMHGSGSTCKIVGTNSGYLQMTGNGVQLYDTGGCSLTLGTGNRCEITASGGLWVNGVQVVVP